MNSQLNLDSISQGDHRKKIWIALVSCLVIYLSYRVRAVLTPLIFSLAVAYILNPFVGIFERRKIPRIVVVIAVFLILAVFAILLFTGIIEVINQAAALVNWLTEKIPDAIQRLNERYPEKFSGKMESVTTEITKAFTSHSGEILQYSFNSIYAILGSAFVLVNLLLLIPLYTFFFLWRFDRIVEVLGTYIPNKHREKTIDIIKKLDQIVASFFRGRLIVCVFVGISTSIGFTLVGVPFAWLLGLGIGVINIVPYAVVFLGLPPVLVITYFSYFDLAHPIYALIVFSIIQFMDGWVLTPIIQGKTLGLHPITTVVVLFIGSELAGIFGLLLAIPAAAAAKVLIREFLWSDFAKKTVERGE